jgi:hypothetical protein
MGDRTPSASVSLVDYEDVSGEFLAKPVESPTATEATTTEPTTTQPPTEKDVETESETVESEEEKPEEDIDANAGAVGMGSILVLGGMLLASFVYFLNQPVIIEHPHTVRGYF